MILFQDTLSPGFCVCFILWFVFRRRIMKLVNVYHVRQRLGERFVCLFFYSHKSISSAIWWLSSLPVTGLQIKACARCSGPLRREWSLLYHTYCDTGPRFIQSHPKDRHPCPTVGFGPWRKDHQIFAPDVLTIPLGGRLWTFCNQSCNLYIIMIRDA
jgi:hypothetical protein